MVPQVNESQRRAFVDDVMGMLELDSVGHRLIGEDADSGLSMGERKRVTIGVELVANPSVLFLVRSTHDLLLHILGAVALGLPFRKAFRRHVLRKLISTP